MTGAELDRLESIVEGLLTLSPDDRMARLRALAHAADPLAAMAARLLARHDQSPGLLASPPDDGALPPGFEPLEDPLVGRRLGEFVLRRLLGVGGMGRVYEAQQKSTGRRVAVKVMTAQVLAGAASIQRFRREAQLLGTLDHPGICRVVTAGSDSVGGATVAYIAMEYVDGTPLLETASTLERRDQIETIARVCDAAHEAHRHGIVHRDLKPGNILLRRSSDPGSPEPVILDFGVGKALAEAGRNASMETEAGQLVGTLAYMSPEQFSGKAVDARVDVYAIGVILYELLSGQKPHETGASLAESARLAAARRAPSLRRVLPAASVDLEAVVARALEPDPARRFASAGELAEDLRPVLQARPVSARKWTAMYRAERFARRHRTPLLAGVVLAIIACAAVLGAIVGLERLGSAAQQLDDLARARRMEDYVASLQQADAALRAEDPAHASAILQAIPEDLRAWEWRYMDRMARRAPAILADPQRDPSVRLTSQAERRFEQHVASHPPFDTVWSQALGVGDLTIIDLPDARVLHRVPDPGVQVLSARLSPNSRSIAYLAGVSERRLCVADAATGQTIAERRILSQEVQHLAFSPDSRVLAMAETSGEVLLFAVPTLEPLSRIEPGGTVHAMAFSPDSSRLAVSYRPRNLALYSVPAGERILDCDTGGVLPASPCFTDDGDRLVSLGDRMTNLHLWDARTGRLIRRQPVPEGPGTIVKIPGQARVAVGCEDGALRIFPTDADERTLWAPVLVLRESDERRPLGFIAARPDGSAICASSGDGHWLVWRLDHPPAEAHPVAQDPPRP